MRRTLDAHVNHMRQHLCIGIRGDTPYPTVIEGLECRIPYILAHVAGCLIAPHLSGLLPVLVLSGLQYCFVCLHMLDVSFFRLTETPHFGWGLYAERDIELGEKLAVLPRSMCLGLPAASHVDGDQDAYEPEDNSWMGPPEVQALVEKIPRMYPDLRWGLMFCQAPPDLPRLC